jgi:hypothetical protein
VELRPDDACDVSEIPDLLDQINAEVASMTANGAHDGESVYDAVAEGHPSATIIIAPRVTSVAGETLATQRVRHLAMIGEHGRMKRQRRSGYNRRSLVDAAAFRYKTIIARRPQARTSPNQKTEAKIGCNVLDRMARLGVPGLRPGQLNARGDRRRGQRPIDSATRRLSHAAAAHRPLNIQVAEVE